MHIVLQYYSITLFNLNIAIELGIEVECYSITVLPYTICIE